MQTTDGAAGVYIVDPYPPEPPPTADELPHTDGDVMESERHFLQIALLIEALRLFWAGRDDGFVGGNMFLYFDLAQTRGRHFRGPDVFVARGVPKRERKSWVVWEEGKGPDVVIELLSPSTARSDRGEKKRVYQDQLRVPEYFLYDPFTGELAGFRLDCTGYREMQPNDKGDLASGIVGLVLTRWQGTYNDVEATWLRWATPDGVVLPTAGEQGAARAEQEAARAHEAQRRVAELEALLARYQRGQGDTPR